MTRPHEALEQRTPNEFYQRSPRKFRGSFELEYPLHDGTIKIDRGGHTRVLRGRGKSFFVSEALANERVGIRELEDGRFLLSFADLDLGFLDPSSNRFHPNTPSVTFSEAQLPMDSPDSQIEVPSIPTLNPVLPMSPD